MMSLEQSQEGKYHSDDKTLENMLIAEILCKKGWKVSKKVKASIKSIIDMKHERTLVQ